VDFRLKQGGLPELRYGELARRIADTSGLTLSKVRGAVLDIRAAKGLLVGEGRESFHSAGSFFRNPVIPASALADIENKIAWAGGCPEWAWPLHDGRIKISAACLIEKAGFARGFRDGRVGISPRHTLIILNYGEASSEEIVTFAAKVQSRVMDEFGIFLVPEVRLVGFPDNRLYGKG